MAAAVDASGVAFGSPSTWRGEAVLRFSVSNWLTEPDDVERTVEVVREAVGSTARGDRAQRATSPMFSGPPRTPASPRGLAARRQHTAVADRGRPTRRVRATSRRRA